MKVFKLLLLLGVIALLHSCSDDIENPDSSTIHYCDEDHTIETRQDSLPIPLFDPCDAFSLFVLVDFSECGDEWNCAINAAIGSYNSLPNNIGIGMTMITDESQLPPGEAVNIEIDCGSILALGSTTRRETADDISEITLNSNTLSQIDDCESSECCSLMKIVMHELGHALGLGHTDITSPGATHIAGTPMTEASSLMNAAFDCADDCQFSPGDITAFGLLYPINEDVPCECRRRPRGMSIEGPDALCLDEIGDEIGEFCVSGVRGVVLQNLTWTINGSNGTSSGFSAMGGCMEFSFPGVGTYTIETQVNFNGCMWPVTKTIVVYDIDCDEICYCACEEEDYSGEIGEYTPVEFEIDCWDKRSCEQIVAERGDLYFDCLKKTR